MSQYKAALIGTGRIASTIDDEVEGTDTLMPMSHMGSYLACSEVDVVGAADPHPQQRDSFSKRYGFPHMFEDYRDMIEKTRPDIVSICTSAKPRADIVLNIAAMDAGVKAIYAEKPISISLDEADRMVEACDKAGIVLAVNCSRRWDPWYTKARQLIDNGIIGDIMHVTVNQFGHLSHNSHMLNLARYLAGGDGRVSWVFGEMDDDEIAKTDDDLGGVSYLAFESGVRGIVRMQSWLFNESEIHGTDGKIRALNDGQEWELWRRSDDPRRATVVRHLFPLPQRIDSPNVRAIRDILHCTETGDQPLSSGEDGRHDLEVAVALRESHRQGGKRIDLPFPDRSQKINSYEVLLGDEPRAIARARDRKGK
jgi:predicted dehydrogenase